jgi:NADH dehydrogenase/NADH:ubiquinone oxidoreductase subunit G
MQVILNNIKCNVHPSETILQVCERMKIEVPKFCYHKKLNVAGNCRMCLVEIEGAPKPVASCAAPVGNNMTIYTNTPFVHKARENVLEFLLLNHPLDCKVCDQGGECDLQEHSKNYGTDRSRNYYYNRRGVENKQLGPIVKTEMTRCIHCTRCVRFVEQLTGNATLGTLTRGHFTEIGTYIKDFLKTELSGNLVDICPVGALTAKPTAFQYRS